MIQPATLARAICCASACALLASGPAAAQETVLRGAQVTESALIDALEVESPAAAASSAKTRGIRPTMTPLGRPAHAGSGKASLLMTFPTDSAELTAETRASLDVVAKALQSDQLAGFAFKIEGHADPRGSAERNQRLSELRAQAVVDYLVTRQGILDERLSALGKGATELLDKQHPEAAENRRVTIVTVRN